MSPLRLRGIVEDVDRAVLSRVDERGMPDQGLTAALDLHQLGELAESPVRDGFGQIGRDGRILLRNAAEGLLSLHAERCAQLRKVAPHVELTAVLVDHLEVEDEMRFELFGLEVLRRALDARLLAHVFGKRGQEALRLRHAASGAGEESLGVLGKGEHVTADFLRELSERSVLSLQAREMTLVNRFSASAPAMVRIDRELLFQLMTMLIRAVGRASGPGETVMLSCFSERHMVVFDVRDTRRVACREELAREFEEFRKEETETALPDPGSLSVLALCFVRDIAAKAGMRLTVRSTPDSWSVLRLEVDGKDCRAGQVGAGGDRWRSNSGDAWMLSGPDGAEETREAVPLRILLGDDNADEAMIIARLLAADAITVDAVDTADAMVAAVEKVSYDGFVMVAPFKSCAPAELVERLRQAAGRRELPVVVVDNQISETLFRQVRSLDRVWAMVMPLNYALLSRLLRRAAGRGRAR